MSNASSLKEPSMEEILASIRRIIESGEERPALPKLGARQEGRASERAADQQSPGTTASQGFAAEAAAMPMATNRLQRPANGETPPAALGRDEEPAAIAAPGRVVPDASEGIALAPLGDIAIESQALDAMEADLPAYVGAVRAKAAASSEPAEAEGDQEVQSFAALRRDEGPAEPAIEAPLATAETEPVGDAAATRDEMGLADLHLEFDEDGFMAELRDEAGLAASHQTEPAVAAPAAFEPAAEHPMPAEVPREPALAAAAASVPERPSMISEASSLMSEEAGSQVAAAFDDLARAIRDGQMKSMEEMAREMLRPMLQEWLDDNLPRLVERLVREEIERVSRGTRR